MTIVGDVSWQDSDFQSCRILCLDLPEDVPTTAVAHELDGVAGPVAPARPLAVGRAPWTAWPGDPSRRRPEVLLGVDASGITPAIALSLASGLPRHLAWRQDVIAGDGPLMSLATH
ncbi:hypothetical protein GCM10010174_86840 [Kutzneria viridogrisea]|uniref:Uncharacterized protein n=2 Tax=Kutzneria TaxID=43356 RepID=W5WM33_9PSEU|nr:hypothetical protein [Kutzneria albida]AHI01841.1 hypothetical protein KALB_8484 [Kutzneria albida DSM 43870]MBA8929740.1 hypothetical protein [Kutzneria viridogrisea]